MNNIFKLLLIVLPITVIANETEITDKLSVMQERGIENATNPEILDAYNKLKEAITLRKNLQSEYLSALSNNADAMKENEQRIENKVLGSTGIGAIGIGAMKLASGINEQQLDNAAEAQMRAYLSTAFCSYNNNQKFSVGDTNITLPTINLNDLKSEYIKLANDLKERKTTLGLKTGIESQEILDSATAGLYDDISTGKSDGVFTSLSAALMSPSGTDATEWAAEKEASSEKIKTGAIVAGVGAVASIAGNIIINKDAPKERSSEITREYEDNIANIDQKISEQQSELDKLITENENIINNYNQELQQHIDFVETITESDCIEQFREYIDYINSLSPITNSYADTSSLEIPYDLKAQQTAYTKCVTQQQIQECNNTANYKWVYGECIPNKPHSIINDTDPSIDAPRIEEKTASEHQQEQTEEEPQIPACPATGNGLSSINEYSKLGDFCKSDIISEGRIAKMENGTCTCIATGCIISHEVKGGRCVKKAEADDDNIEDTNKYVDENGFCTPVTLTYVWTKAPNQTIQQNDISKHFNKECDKHAATYNCTRTDFNTSHKLTDDTELLEVEWTCNATSDDYIAAKERINEKYSNLKYQNFCTTKNIKKNQMNTLTSGAKASCITFFDEYSIPDYETQLVLAQTYMKQKVSAEEQFYSTTNACQTADKRINRTDGRTGQYLNCNTLDDKVRFTFSFYNTPHQQEKNEKTNPDTLMQALCDIFNVKYGKQQNKNPYCNYSYNKKDSTKDEICNKIDYVVQNFGYRANIVHGTGCVLDPSGGLAGEKAQKTGMKSDQKIKDNKLRTFYDLDNYMFSNISTNMNEWLYNQMHIIVQKEMQNKGHRDELVEFECDPTKAFVMDSRNVLTCTANGHEIDFVFKQLGGTSKRRANASQEGLTCIFGQNGKYDGEHCWGLTKEKCTQLDYDIKQAAGSECPSCGAEWNDTDFAPDGACVLTKSTKVKKTDRGVEIGVGVTLTVGSAVLTFFSGGATYELLVFTAAETTGLIWSAVQDKKIGKVADNFMAKVQYCHDATCAQELLTDDEVARILNLESNLDEDQVKTIDDKLAELIGYLPADSELGIALAVTMAEKTKCNFWKNLTYQCEPEQFYKAVAEVLTFASLFWSVGRSGLRFIRSPQKLQNLAKDVTTKMNFADAKYLDDEAKNLKRAQEELKKNPSRSDAQQLRTKITKHKQNIQTRKNKLGITDDAALAVAKSDAYRAHDIDLAHQEYDNLLKKRNEWDNYMKNHNGNPPQNVGKKEIENLNNQIAQAEKKLTDLGETVQPANKLELPTVAPKAQPTAPDFDKLAKQADRNFNRRLNSFKNGKPQNLTKKNLNDDQWKQLSDHLEETEGIRIVETNKNGTTFMSFEKVDNAASITNKSDDIVSQVDNVANINRATTKVDDVIKAATTTDADNITSIKNKLDEEFDWMLTNMKERNHSRTFDKKLLTDDEWTKLNKHLEANDGFIIREHPTDKTIMIIEPKPKVTNADVANTLIHTNDDAIEAFQAESAIEGIRNRASRTFTSQMNSFKAGKSNPSIVKSKLDDNEWQQLNSYLKEYEGVQLVETTERGIKVMKFEKVGDTGTIANKVDDAADITRSATAPKSNRYKIQKTIKPFGNYTGGQKEANGVFEIIDNQSGQIMYLKRTSANEVNMTKRAANVNLGANSAVRVVQPADMTPNEINDMVKSLGITVPDYVKADTWLLTKAVPDGENLMTIVKNGGRLTDGTKITNTEIDQIISGMKKLRTAGINHTDLYTNTIVRRTTNGKLEAHIIDFESAGIHDVNFIEKELNKIKTIENLNTTNQSLTDINTDVYNRAYQKSLDAQNIKTKRNEPPVTMVELDLSLNNKASEVLNPSEYKAFQQIKQYEIEKMSLENEIDIAIENTPYHKRDAALKSYEEKLKFYNTQIEGAHKVYPKAGQFADEHIADIEKIGQANINTSAPIDDAAIEMTHIINNTIDTNQLNAAVLKNKEKIIQTFPKDLYDELKQWPTASLEKRKELALKMQKHIETSMNCDGNVCDVYFVHSSELGGSGGAATHINDTQSYIRISEESINNNNINQVFSLIAHENTHVAQNAGKSTGLSTEVIKVSSENYVPPRKNQAAYLLNAKEQEAILASKAYQNIMTDIAQYHGW